MSYLRVIPRDLFNESKLLKCLGQVSLMLETCPHRWPIKIFHQNPETGFVIQQDKDDGSIYCGNIQLYHETSGLIHLYCGLNSRKVYPLQFNSGYETGFVFESNGCFTGDFLTMVKK